MSSLLIRDAVVADALGVAHVHVRSWQVGYRGLLPDAYLDGLSPDERAKRYTFGSLDASQPATIIAVEDGAIRGFATTMPARDSNVAGMGELAALYVEPESWGRGIGGALIDAAHARLASRGFRKAVLWLLQGNNRGLRFYERRGWAVDGIGRTDRVWGVTVQEIRLQRPLL